MKPIFKHILAVLSAAVCMFSLSGCSGAENTSVPSSFPVNNAYRVKVQKKDNTITVTQGKNIYTLARHTDLNVQLDTWRLTQQAISGQRVWKDADIEGSIKQKDTADFISGYHGDEQLVSVEFYWDGERADADADWSTCYMDDFTVRVVSHVFYCDTQTVAFSRTKTLQFTDSTLTISNHWELIGEQSFTVLTNTGGGTWSVYCDLIRGYNTNIDPTIKNRIGTAGGKQLNRVTFFGINDFTVTIRGLSEIDEHYTADISYFAEESRPRIKPYFMTVYNASPKVMNRGDVMECSFSIQVS